MSGQKIMVEFVSANPTGPMHMGNARGGVLGDTLAERALPRRGCDVWREFYVNDAGNQIEKFAASIEARYLQTHPGRGRRASSRRTAITATTSRSSRRAFLEENGDRLAGQARGGAPRGHGPASASPRNMPKMKADLARYGIEYDEWFFESSLHESGYVAETVSELTERGLHL